MMLQTTITTQAQADFSSLMDDVHYHSGFRKRAEKLLASNQR